MSAPELSTMVPKVPNEKFVIFGIGLKIRQLLAAVVSSCQMARAGGVGESHCFYIYMDAPKNIRNILSNVTLAKHMPAFYPLTHLLPPTINNLISPLSSCELHPFSSQHLSPPLHIQQIFYVSIYLN